MLADYFTKPLQGALFYKLRDRIMNIDPSSEYHSSAHRSVLRNVENNDHPDDVTTNTFVRGEGVRSDIRGGMRTTEKGCVEGHQ